MIVASRMVYSEPVLYNDSGESAFDSPRLDLWMTVPPFLTQLLSRINFLYRSCIIPQQGNLATSAMRTNLKGLSCRWVFYVRREVSVCWHYSDTVSKKLKFENVLCFWKKHLDEIRSGRCH